MSQTEIKLSFFENFMLSGIAAFFSRTLTSPIDYYFKFKVAGLDTHYKRVKFFLRKIVEEKRVLSLWKNNISICLAYSPFQALNFALKEKCSEFIQPTKSNSRMIFFTKNIVSGGIAGSLLCFFFYPLDYCGSKLRYNDLNRTKGTRQNKILDIFWNTLTNEGVTALYKGAIVTCLSVFLYRGFYFGLYDSFRVEDSSFLFSFTLGYIVSIISGFLSHPLLRIKLKMISGEDNSNYKGAFDCAKKNLKAEGAIFMIKGFERNIYESITRALILVGFDKLTKYYRKNSKINNELIISKK
jgi:solute carrier family 25 (adenine nucleotide translocator) protein 4/5/6/31